LPVIVGSLSERRESLRPWRKLDVTPVPQRAKVRQPAHRIARRQRCFSRSRHSDRESFNIGNSPARWPWPPAGLDHLCGGASLRASVRFERARAGRTIAMPGYLTKIDDLRSTRSPEAGSQLRSEPVHPEQRSLVVLKRVHLLSHRQLSSVNGQVGRGD
jgi:hypothetical protein